MTPRQPPEWAPHAFVWIGFPSHGELWEEDLSPAQAEVVAFAAAVWADGKGEEVRLVAADAASAEAARADAPFATVVTQPFGDIWLRDTGLMNDHTDGHVDNLARFVARGKIAIPEPAQRDPNEAVYRDAANRARRFGLDVVLVPSPGEVTRGEEIIPASYMNFYIGNATV